MEINAYYYCPQCNYSKILCNENFNEIIKFEKCPKCDFLKAGKIPLTAMYYTAKEDYEFLAQSKIKTFGNKCYIEEKQNR